jgi:hypothetical protein
MTASSTRDTEEDERSSLDREVDMIQRALDDRGQMQRRDLETAVGARYWGPGRFTQALREALRRRAIKSPARGRFGPS